MLRLRAARVNRMTSGYEARKEYEYRTNEGNRNKKNLSIMTEAIIE